MELPRPDVEPGDARLAVERHAAGGRAADERRHRAERLAHAVDGAVVRAQELARREQRDQLAGLIRRQELGPGMPQHCAAADLALVVLPALRRARELQRADREEARLAVDVERREQLDGLERETGHRARVVRGEEPARRMGRGAARGRDRSLVDHDDVRQPRFARWYAALAPTMPAPMTTSDALRGNRRTGRRRRFGHAVR